MNLVEREYGQLNFWPGDRGQWEPSAVCPPLFPQEMPLSELGDLIPLLIPQTLIEHLLFATSCS